MITEGLLWIGWNEEFAYQYDDTGPFYFLYNNATVKNVAQSVDESHWAELDFNIETYGYSYSASTITVKIAITFILLRALVALLHTVIVCAAPRVWICDSWDTVGQRKTTECLRGRWVGADVGAAVEDQRCGAGERGAFW